MISDERRRELNLELFTGKVREQFEAYVCPHPDSVQRMCRQRAFLAVDSLKANLAPGARILDVGCGTGATAVPLSKAGFDVTGIDLVEPMLDVARRSASSVTWVREAFTDKLFARGSFDAVLSLGYLEYQERAGKELVRMGRLLKPGGLLLLSVPNTLSRRFGMGLSRAFFRMGKEPEWISVRHSYTPERLQRHLGMAGFILLDYQWLGGEKLLAPLSKERPRDFFVHRVRDRFAPELLAMARTYRPDDTRPS